LYLLPLSSVYSPAGTATRLTLENLSVGGPCWISDGRIAYSSGGIYGYRTLRMIAIDPNHRGRGVPLVPPAAGEHATLVSSVRNRLVYAREQRDSNIWSLPLSKSKAGARPSRLITSTFDDHTPDFSPDGKRIVFASTRSGNEEIWVANADGSNPFQMTSFGGPNTSNPRWSRNGRTILVNSRCSGSWDLYLLEVATRAVRRLTDDPGEEGEPTWSRDGEWIYFGASEQVWKIRPGDGAASQVKVIRHGGRNAYESTDGRFLYYAKSAERPTSIWRVPIDGGEETKVIDGLSYGFNFAVSARGIYFLALRGDSRVASVEFFDFASRKTAVLHTLDGAWWYGFALSPDESSLLFSQVDSLGSDLMMVENLR
jgi:Tol biopolymer transport system component